MTSKAEDEVEAARNGAGSFPRAVPQDNVEYSVHLLIQYASDVERRDKLRQIQTASAALLKKHLKDYIWEQDSFQLQLRKNDGISYLSGRSFYGDSVEDEWIIVWLLVELSKQFEDVWIRSIDADGEFLLIESANALPRWLNPEIADNRVWINRGHLRIIPRSSNSANQTGSLKFEHAVEFLQKEESSLLTDPKIEEEAFYRLKNYPGGIKDSLHHSLIRLPRKVAYLLQKQPIYISAAIESFYLRDPIALKPLRKSNESDLLFPPQDMVTLRTKFTRIGFAKVRSQEFPYPPSWVGIERQVLSDSKASFQAEMGMKLTCGFEMLLSDPQNKDKKSVREIKLILEDLEAGEDRLPSDEEIKALGITEDDDSWLNIDYEEFEKELAGKQTNGMRGPGFGSSDTQDKLKKMVSRFEDLLSEEKSGFDLDDMDEDNDTDIEDANDDSGSESNNSAEEDFDKMMQELLGMSKETMDEMMGRVKSEAKQKGKDKAPEVTDGNLDDDDDEEEIRRLTEAMEAELRASGALKLDNGLSKGKTKAIGAVKTGNPEAEAESSDDELLDEDYNLAKNMLESFKSQGGVTGPAGNLMGMLGVQMPRDEHESD